MQRGHHPWRVFRHESDWTLVWAELGDDVLGETCWETKTITLDVDLLHADRRVTICHETQHIQRGPAHPDPVMQAKEHNAIDRMVAWLLIDLHPLGEAMAWSQDRHEIADELQVNVHTLEIRLQYLHASERAYLMRRLSHD